MAVQRHLLAFITLAGSPLLGQRPTQPFCSNNPLDKLPVCAAPASPAPLSPGQSSPSGQPTPSAKPVEQFPFPDEHPKPANAPSGTADKFPFPVEDVPAPVLDPTEKPYRPDPVPSSGTSSSSSSASDDSVPALKDEGTEGTSRAARRRLPKVEDLGAREEEDVRIANYYYSTGNYQAAYNRAKDAVRLDPTDADAQIALAKDAQRLARKDEAIAAYAKYLELAPDGRDAKLARKALAAFH